MCVCVVCVCAYVCIALIESLTLLSYLRPTRCVCVTYYYCSCLLLLLLLLQQGQGCRKTVYGLLMVVTMRYINSMELRTYSKWVWIRIYVTLFRATNGILDVSCPFFSYCSIFLFKMLIFYIFHLYISIISLLFVVGSPESWASTGFQLICLLSINTNKQTNRSIYRNVVVVLCHCILLHGVS